MELSFTITSLTELDYDGVSETVKQVTPAIDGKDIAHTYIRLDTETDADAKTAVKTDLINKGYTWDTEA